MSIFMREGWTAGGKCVLERALVELASDLGSGRIETYLETIRVFRVECEDLKGRVTLVPASYVDSDLESWYDETAGDDEEQVGEEVRDEEQETTPATEEETYDIGPPPVERLAERGIELIHINMIPEHGSGDRHYGTIFPNDAEVDYYLLDEMA